MPLHLSVIALAGQRACSRSRAGLTNPAVQKRFGTGKPVWGVLYRSMLLVRVKSEAVNRAKTPGEVLAAEGVALKPGYLVSLGSFSPLLPPKPGLAVTASYDGLPGA